MADASLGGGCALWLVAVPALPLEGAGGAGARLTSTEREMAWAFTPTAHGQRAI